MEVFLPQHAVLCDLLARPFSRSTCLVTWKCTNLEVPLYDSSSVSSLLQSRVERHLVNSPLVTATSVIVERPCADFILTSFPIVGVCDRFGRLKDLFWAPVVTKLWWLQIYR
jgi:hypothetical protein